MEDTGVGDGKQRSGQWNHEDNRIVFIEREPSLIIDEKTCMITNKLYIMCYVSSDNMRPHV